MKRTFLWSLLLVLASAANAQPFIAEQIFDLPEGEEVRMSWGDMDGDGLLDLVIFAQGQDQTTIYCLTQQDSLHFSQVQLPFGEQAKLNFQLKDFDHDGRLDIIWVNGLGNSNLVVARNTGNLTFDLLELDFPVDEFIINDLDRDGNEDIIASSGLASDVGAIYLILHDSIFKEAGRIEGVTLTTGRYFIEEELLHCVLRTSKGMNQLGYITLKDDSFSFRTLFEFPGGEVYAFGDLNHDGSVDMASAVENQLVLYYLQGDQHEIVEMSGADGEIVEIHIGDVDLDGLADILFTKMVEQQANLFFYKNPKEMGDVPDGAFFELNDAHINELADINDDGDLDLMSIIQGGLGVSFYVQLNQTAISNDGPEPVFINPPYSVYDQTFFSWYRTADDHTDTLAISYELFIEFDASEIYHTMPGYDMDTSTRDGFRKIVGHGYQWFDTHYKAKSLENGRYYWGVVGIDNAYYASSDIRKCKAKGPCVDVYTPINCFDLLVEDTIVCQNSILTVDLKHGADSVKWYSVKKGFLEKSPVLNFRVLEPDTIYGVYFPQIPCDQPTDQCVLNYSIAIGVKKSEEFLFENIEYCPDSENIITVEGAWDSVRWWYKEEIVAHGNHIILDSIPGKPLVAEAFKQDLCPVYDTLELVIIERLLDPASLSDTIIACADQATRIDLFEDQDPEQFLFTWKPPELFDDPALPNPFITASEVEPVTVIVTQNKCYSDTITFGLKLFPLPEITTNGDQEIFRGEKVLLIAEGAAQYSWIPATDLQSPNSGTTWGEPPETITYTVSGTGEQGCYAESNVTVIVKNSVFIPDLFSPNGDGRNDYLHVYGEGIGSLSFRVFDERGSLMVEMDETSNVAGWDGLVSGNELPSGTYFWTVSGEFTNGASISYHGKNKGSVRLVR